MKKVVQYFTKKRSLIVWHPTIPGEKVKVERNWFQRMLFPRYFATNKELVNYESTLLIQAKYTQAKDSRGSHVMYHFSLIDPISNI